MNTAEQTLAAYPHCQQAVAYSELILDCREDDGESCFDIIRAAALSLDEAVDLIKQVTSAECELPVTPEILQQLDHPEFRTYLKAKLGYL